MNSILSKIHKFPAMSASVLLLGGCATTAETVVSSEKSETLAASAPIFTFADIDEKQAVALDVLLGDADLVRVEEPGEFRRYDFKQCALLIVLYPEDGGLKVNHVEAVNRETSDSAPDLDACLAAGR